MNKVIHIPVVTFARMNLGKVLEQGIAEITNDSDVTRDEIAKSLGYKSRKSLYNQFKKLKVSLDIFVTLQKKYHYPFYEKIPALRKLMDESVVEEPLAFYSTSFGQVTPLEEKIMKAESGFAIVIMRNGDYLMGGIGGFDPERHEVTINSLDEIEQYFKTDDNIILNHMSGVKINTSRILNIIPSKNLFGLIRLMQKRKRQIPQTQNNHSTT